MYKKSNKVLGKNIQSLNNYIQGIDVYNSVLLTYLTNPELPRKKYEITVYEYRPDLISKEFYGSENYLGILLVQTAMELSGFSKGTILSLITKETIDQILSSL